jgi:mono/diheme cytochrome c family protein
MTTIKNAVFRQRIKRLMQIVGLILMIGAIDFLTGDKLGAVLEAMSAPQLPALPQIEREDVIRLNKSQNWNDDTAAKFHHISQGTSTLPVPLSWLRALEQPASSLFTIPFGDRGKFSDNSYLLRFGFIEGEISELNPAGLPVGFALSHYESLEGINNKGTVVGFNCAACHTSQLIYDNKRYIIEGGAAPIDLGQLTKALGAALGQTLISSKFPIFNGRFNRFAEAVLKDDAYSDKNAADLASELQARVVSLAQAPSEVDVVEGFARLDALNRIGNQVFAIDPKRYSNYVAINAPVNFPHLWTASWFDWVQYDGSIMQPLVRNTGEAMGVRARINTTAPDGQNRFSSSVPVSNLYWIEQALSGDNPFPDGSTEGLGNPFIRDPATGKNRLTGLSGPKWPEAFGKIDEQASKRGEVLYGNHCAGCHLPPLNSADFWRNKNTHGSLDSPVNGDKYFEPTVYYSKKKGAGHSQQDLGADGRYKHATADALLKMNIVSLQQVGTDSATADTMRYRTVDTAGDTGGTRAEHTAGMGISADVCTWTPESLGQGNTPVSASRLVDVTVKDGPDELFGLALGAIVQQVNKVWFNQNFIAEQDQAIYEGHRPNCLQSTHGYKARPHDGIWATAPFLHNGSIATVYDLLSPQEERPKYVQLGNIAFDPVRLGLAQPRDITSLFSPGDKYSSDGYFILDTTVAGNSNQGHEFSADWDDNKDWSEQDKGVIGPFLPKAARLDLVEFLKTQ